MRPAKRSSYAAREEFETPDFNSKLTLSRRFNGFLIFLFERNSLFALQGPRLKKMSRSFVVRFALVMHSGIEIELCNQYCEGFIPFRL